MQRVLLASALALLAGCERAGADIENASTQQLEVRLTLRDRDGPGAISVAPGQTLQSVWFVEDHRQMIFSYAGRSSMLFRGEKLKALGQRRPRHCILRVSERGVRAIATDLFGKPKD